jgi:flagellin-like hook-associated protein FlgL
MDENKDQDQENNSTDKAEAAKAPPGASAAAPANAESAAANDLPQVDSPKLDGGAASEEPEAEAVHGRANGGSVYALPALFKEPVREAPREASAAAADAQPRSFRFALLAATIACAAGIGGLVGSLWASGIGHEHTAVVAIPRAADARDVAQALRAELAELSSLKASLDSANRGAGAQFAKIADRLDSLERAQTEPAAKLARLAETVDRLEKRTNAASEITGSIAAAPPAAPATPAPPAAAAKLTTAPVLHGWIVQDVRNGRAMVESRHGGLFLVGSGSLLPGLGRVQDVKRQDGEWVVVTEKGLITQNP